MPIFWSSPLLSLNGEILKLRLRHYEERLLFSLIRLQNPRTRLIYVIQPLHPSVLLVLSQLLPEFPFSHADRLLLLSLTIPLSNLTQKIIERPVCQADSASFTPRQSLHDVTILHLGKENYPVRLGLPPVCCLAPYRFGDKIGSRQIFAESSASSR